MRQQSTVISILNQKGGVAKTTTTANLGSCLAAAGHRTLLIDLDPQANLSLGLGARQLAGRVGLHDVLQRKSGVRLEHVVSQVPGLPLFVAPASYELALAEALLTPVLGSGTRLKQALEPYLSFADFVLIDCPPSLGRLTEMAVVASTHLLVPCEPKLYSFAGMDTLNRMVQNLQNDLDIQARLLGVVLTMYEQRTRLHRMIAAEVRNQFGELVFKTPIRRTVRVSESELEGRAAVILDPSSTAARDYGAVTAELLERLNAAGDSVPIRPDAIRAERRDLPLSYPLITTPPDVMMEPDGEPSIAQIIERAAADRPESAESTSLVPLSAVVSRAPESNGKDLVVSEPPLRAAVNGRPPVGGRFGEYLQLVTRKLTRRR